MTRSFSVGCPDAWIRRFILCHTCIRCVKAGGKYLLSQMKASGGSLMRYSIFCSGYFVVEKHSMQGEHLITIEHSVLGPTCGLLPVGVDSTILTTRGLRWNLSKVHPSSW